MPKDTTSFDTTGNRTNNLMIKIQTQRERERQREIERGERGERGERDKKRDTEKKTQGDHFEVESGQGMVEYGLIIALVGVALIAALGTLKGKISTVFETDRKSVV